MKNFKIIETLVACMFSLVLASFAVSQEKNLQTPATSTVTHQQTKPAAQSLTGTFSFSSAAARAFDGYSSVSFSKLISLVAIAVAAISLIIIIVGFLFYNLYSIRP